MEKKKLGSQGLEVSHLGLGCMGMSEFYGSNNDEESIKTIHHAVDLGITFFDTSDMYGPFKNEELLGKAFKGIRDKVVIASKFGILRTGDPNVRAINGRPEYVKSSCDASLKRLGVDYIDLYYQHRIDANTPIEDTVGAMADLVKEGKVRFIGLSEAGSNTIKRAHKIHPLTALQSEYSLWSRDPEDEILHLVNELGIGFVAYSPLGRGFLTGRFKTVDDLEQNDYRRVSPRFQGDNFKKNLRLIDTINEIAKTKGVTPGQLALAWVLARNKIIVPIPVTTKAKHLDENIAALEIKITEEELSKIDKLLPAGSASGTRYPESMMSLLNG